MFQKGKHFSPYGLAFFDKKGGVERRGGGRARFAGVGYEHNLSF